NRLTFLFYPTISLIKGDGVLVLLYVCNGDDRGQWPKQGGAVGAAASKMQAAAQQMLGAATRARLRRDLTKLLRACK
ncbi:MAG: hypothetical protein ACLR29_14280, partial [Faecalibacterium prausnitzii]